MVSRIARRPLLLLLVLLVLGPDDAVSVAVATAAGWVVIVM